ncbi:hypothetical protein [Viridibacterium curvum]|uniref:Uncharacterized protein n=1 Tax=Viridibacterium curvum TaxID=1101404 RepID=A0ABP9R158_9RHOO
MRLRFLHLLTHAGLETHRVSGSTLQRAQLFAQGEAGVLAFSEWLAQVPTALHSMLVDVADEGFHLESIPHTMGSDRRALIQRRLTQQFFGSPYATAISLGRERSGRRDERLLLMAITRPALLEPWLAALHRHEARLSALYTVPLLAGDLIRKLAPGIPRGLILLLTGNGIRQLHFEDGRLRFSRLAPAPEGPFASWGLDCLREAQKTWQYLNAQRWIPRGTALPVILVANAADGSALLSDVSRARQADDKLQFRLAPIDTAARQLGFSDTYAESDSQSLVMQLAVRERSGGAQLASAEDRHFYRQWQIRFAALGGCAAALAAALVMSAHWLVDSGEDRTAAASLRAEAASFDQRYTNLLGTLPRIPSSVDALRTAVEGMERIRNGITDPREALTGVSKALSGFTDITLEQLDWQSVPDKPGAQNLLLIASLDQTSGNNPRATLERIQTFVAAVEQSTGANVVLVQQPFDTGSDKLLRSDANLSAKRPQFRLQLDWKERS